MVSIENAKGPAVCTQGPKEVFTGKLFSEDEKERASYIAKGLENLTVQEAENLLDRFKCYLHQTVFLTERR